MTGGSGPTSNGSSVRYDPATCSWKTCQALFEQDYPLSSIPLPTSGSMRNGECSERPPLAPRTVESGSGLWPTATAHDGKGDAPSQADRKSPGLPQASLTVQAKMWPTPRAMDGFTSPAARQVTPGISHGMELPRRAKMWPTPRAPEGFMGTDPQHGTGGHHGPTTMTGGPNGMVLNPRFVEALMGLPDGWLTPSISAATDSSPSALELPGTSSQNAEPGK